MRSLAGSSTLFLVFLLSGCGGSVERDPGTGGAAGGTPTGQGGASFPSNPLGKCEAGHAQADHPELPCPWLADGLCYASKPAACACACPKDHDSVCLSDFPDPSGAPVNVSCD